MRIGAQNPAIAGLLKELPAGVGKGKIGTGEDFGEMVKQILGEVNDSQHQARGMQNDYLQGKKIEIHDLMISMEKASTSMALTMQVRNKVLEAYQEISRTQI